MSIKYAFTNRLFDGEGHGYHTGFPPLAIILAYVVFQILRIEISVLNLQIFICNSVLFHSKPILSHYKSWFAYAVSGVVILSAILIFTMWIKRGSGNCQGYLQV